MRYVDGRFEKINEATPVNSQLLSDIYLFLFVAADIIFKDNNYQSQSLQKNSSNPGIIRFGCELQRTSNIYVWMQ